MIKIFKKFRQLSWVKKSLILLVVLMLLMGLPIHITGQTSFCNSCHIMNNYYASWQSSSHEQVNCLDCHLQPGFGGFIKGKINGLAQAVDCAVGRMGTKPSATVVDASCLRSGCHDVERLSKQPVEYKKYKFAHEKHIGNNVDGIQINCTTCHNHFEGEEHFSVNTQACFTCHFLENDETSERLVDTKCQSCHNVPTETMKRGWIEVNHEDFLSYQASCEESCHQRQIKKSSKVVDSVCLNCHDYSHNPDYDSLTLHHLHTNKEKVECFSCHGEIVHGTSEGVALTAMLDCQSCHSDTHELQQTIYNAAEHQESVAHENELSPMFLSHVQCNGCHVDTSQTQSGSINSLGTVAKATPAACDRCHQAGTGEKYVPFWQDQIKKLYAKIEDQTNRLDEKSQNELDETLLAVMRQKINRTRQLLKLVADDGSWGVHNLKYTETILKNAKAVLTEKE